MSDQDALVPNRGEDPLWQGPDGRCDRDAGARWSRVFGAVAGLARLGVGVFFLMAAGAKVVLSDGHGSGVTYGLSTFAAVIEGHHVIPASSASVVAFASVALEVVLGLWLLSHRRARLAALVSIAFMAVFCVYLTMAYIRVGDAPCGCLGKLTSSKLTDAIVRNAALVALLLPSLVNPGRLRAAGGTINPWA